MNKPLYFPHDSPLRWLIESKTQSGKTYLVDLGMMECQCRYWQCDVGPALRDGRAPRRFCSHYGTARQRFTDWAIWAFHQKDPNRKHDDSLNATPR